MGQQLREWRCKMLNKYGLNFFWYFAFIDNLPTILKYGILSKNEADRKGLKCRSFAEQTVQIRRKSRDIHLTNRQAYTVHDLVPVYLCPKTPTLSARRTIQSDIFFICITSQILLEDNIEFAFTDGNAASSISKCYHDLKNLRKLPWEVINADYWNNYEDGMRKRNSEFLIYPNISASHFIDIGVFNAYAKAKAKKILLINNSPLNVEIRKDWFF